MKDFKPEIVWMPIDSIQPYINNIKKHPAKQIEKLAQAIAKFGWTQPIVVDANHVVIAGHGRLEAAQKLRLELVPVVITDMDEHEAAAARIADNKIAELGDWDEDMLRFELGTLERAGMDLVFTGFEEKELQKLMSEGEVKPEKAPPIPVEQWIVAIECSCEADMQVIFEEMQARGLQCKIIT